MSYDKLGGPSFNFAGIYLSHIVMRQYDFYF